MRSIIVSLAVTALTVASAGVASAQTTFLFDWSGAPFNNGASATGAITFAAGFPTNPGAAVYTPGVEMLALDVTVSGASGGNGAFTMVDFAIVVFDTGGATLDLTTELVGQPTPGGPWGTPSPVGATGDFAIHALSPTAPTATFFFELTTNGGSGDKMALTSFRPVPEPGTMALLGLGGLLAARRRR